MNKQKKNIYGIVFFIILIVLIFIKVSMPYVLPLDSNVKYSDNPVSHREEILLKFIDNKLTNSSGGIKTNYVDKKSEGDITKGNAVLSESEGMMLIYYLERNEKENFDKVLNYIENNMILDNNLISWRVEGNNKNQTSATIDDLRIVKALLLANERWGKFHYRKLAIKISRAINEKLLDVDVLSDFYDGYGKSDITTLCYIDLPTLDYLSNIDYKWKKVYSGSLKLLNDGYISNKVPLYRTNYNRKTKKYDNENTTDTLLSLICILNKLELNQSAKSSIDWIENKFKKDEAIYSKYNVSNGEKASDIESTSIYALLVRIGYQSKNKNLYNMALRKLESFQVLDKKSELYGAYGDTNTLNVYSFDNLNALLAYRDVK